MIERPASPFCDLDRWPMNQQRIVSILQCSTNAYGFPTIFRIELARDLGRPVCVGDGTLRLFIE
jgi:hypothetical protein